jgi:hypothetical protein
MFVRGPAVVWLRTYIDEKYVNVVFCKYVKYSVVVIKNPSEFIVLNIEDCFLIILVIFN